MKALTTAGLTKLIQLIKSSFISNTDTVTTNTVTLATVATSGDYDDLTNKPTIPTVNDATLTIQKNGVDVQTFTANASTNATANITVPTDTGDLTNNAGFITSSALNGYATETYVDNGLATKQDTLVSGTNIKTINNTSLLGSGNIDTSEIFIATGTTTYAEITSALSNNKKVFYNSGNIYYQHTYSTSTEYQFASVISTYSDDIRIEYATIDISNVWSLQTYTVADTDLSNLSSNGQKVIDGQWVSQTATVVENLQLHTNNNISYTISQIPDDGYKYEVILSCLGTSTTTSGQSTALFISSSELNYAQCVYRGTPRSTANVMVGGSIIIPLGTDRGITIQRSEDYYGTANIYLRGYRRIGSNT